MLICEKWKTCDNKLRLHRSPHENRIDCQSECDKATCYEITTVEEVWHRLIGNI